MRTPVRKLKAAKQTPQWSNAAILRQRYLELAAKHAATEARYAALLAYLPKRDQAVADAVATKVSLPTAVRALERLTPGPLRDELERRLKLAEQTASTGRHAVSGPDEKWYRDGDPDRPYWRPSTLAEDRWIVIHGEMPAEPATDGPGRPPDARVESHATTEPAPIPVTRAQRIRNLMAQVRSGDRTAAQALREALMSDD